jgi:hypothetical protein
LHSPGDGVARRADLADKETAEVLQTPRPIFPTRIKRVRDCPASIGHSLIQRKTNRAGSQGDFGSDRHLPVASIFGRRALCARGLDKRSRKR